MEAHDEGPSEFLAWINEWLAGNADLLPKILARMQMLDPNRVQEGRDLLGALVTLSKSFTQANTPSIFKIVETALKLHSAILLRELPDLEFIGDGQQKVLCWGEELGRGNYARVLWGCDSLGRPVAIKKIDMRRFQDKKMRENLQNEVYIMSSLDHNNIVRLYHYVATSHYLYLVLEYCAGGDLKQYIKARGAVPEEQTRAIIMGIELQRRQIVHRDLKPENILFLEPDKKTVKLADFTFVSVDQWSSLIDQARVSEDNRLITSQCGSPLYMAPEIVFGNGYTNKVDVWSVGVIFYELIAGQPPFALNYRSLMRQLSHPADVELPPDVNISAECRDLLVKMLKKDPNCRISWNEVFRHPFLCPRKLSGPLPDRGRSASALSDLQARLSVVRSQLEETEKRLKESEAREKAALAREQELSQKVETLTTQCSELRAQMQNRDKAVHELQKKLAAAVADKEAMAAQLAEVKKQLEDLWRKDKTSQETIAQKDREIECLQKRAQLHDEEAKLWASERETWDAERKAWNVERKAWEQEREMRTDWVHISRAQELQRSASVPNIPPALPSPGRANQEEENAALLQRLLDEITAARDEQSAAIRRGQMECNRVTELLKKKTAELEEVQRRLTALEKSSTEERERLLADVAWLRAELDKTTQKYTDATARLEETNKIIAELMDWQCALSLAEDPEK